jgi:hypothetical protein
MEHKHLSEVAESQLDRVLAFFPRADAKGSVLLAVDTGMLAILASSSSAWNTFDRWIWVSLIPLLLIGISLWHLYMGAFPSLKGGHDSLIYFREISKRTESKFIEEFLAQSDETYVKDLLSQVWRNSEILREKFNHISAAFNWTALAIVPWLSTMILLNIRYASKSPLLR